MDKPRKIKKLDEVVVNRIAAGEVIQRPANALKELIENSLDAKATNIQIIAKEGGMKLLQIQDNGTGIRKEDMEIVCERFTTSKLQTFEDLKSISTFGFRGEALASISHVALLTITTKTVDEKCAYKATYVDSKLKAPPKSCAGNQGTTIMIENLFYNVPTRRKALVNISDEFTKISEVVTRYAIHNPQVGFMLKKHGEANPQVRTPHNSTKMSNIRILYGNAIARELLEIEYNDDTYKFKTHCLITNPNYAGKRMVFLLFINNRLVDSSSIKKMLEDLYSVYLPKKTHPWCYISLEINPNNIDVNVHPTKHEVKFLHEDSIIEKMRHALDEKLAGNSASRTFYLQSRLPKTDINESVLKEVLPEYDKNNSTDKSKKVYAHQMIRMDATDQKLDKFNFTIETKNNANISMNKSVNDSPKASTSKETENEMQEDQNTNAIFCQEPGIEKETENSVNEINIPDVKASTSWSDIVDTSQSVISVSVEETDPLALETTLENASDKSVRSPNINDILRTLKDETDKDLQNKKEKNKSVDVIADEARKKIYQIFGNTSKKQKDTDDFPNRDEIEENKEGAVKIEILSKTDDIKIKDSTSNKTEIKSKASNEFKSYSVNNFRREVRLTSVLLLRKSVENDCHEGLREILSNLIYVGSVDEKSALIQSGVNLYICNTKRLAEELFYEIMLYDFANHGAIKFSNPIPLYDLALLGLETEEAGWTEEDGSKDQLAKSVQELLLEKADMLKDYFSIIIDKNGYLKSLPVLLDKYFPHEAGLPLFILRLATEVDWKREQSCFQNICRETAKYFSQMNPTHGEHDWKFITEHVLYAAIKESLLPPKQFAHDSTILQITSLPDLYKVFERC